MARKASLFRLDPDTQTALAHLSQLLARPMNKLVNEAVKNYLLKTSQAEHEVEETLAGLRAYRQRMLNVAEPPAAYVAARGELDAETLAAAREFVARVVIRYSVSAAFVFGSRARGTQRPDSDIDIAVVIRDTPRKVMDVSIEMADIAYDLLLDTNAYIQPLPIWEDQWEHPLTHSNPRLVENIKREGFRL